MYHLVGSLSIPRWRGIRPNAAALMSVFAGALSVADSVVAGCMAGSVAGTEGIVVGIAGREGIRRLVIGDGKSWKRRLGTRGCPAGAALASCHIVVHIVADWELHMGCTTVDGGT